MKKKLLFLLVVVLAFVLRFYQLGLNPPSLYWDETINCYDAYSLGQTGRDHHGVIFPITHLISYGDFKNPLYTYLTILPVKFFGLNELACRFPSAFFGWLTVIIIFFLVRELLKKTKIALLAAFLLAVSPWHLQFSRAGFEANINLFFIILGIYLFIKAVNSKPFLLIFSAISFALTPYAYHSSKLFMPLLVAGLSFFYIKTLLKNLKWVILSLILGLAIIYPLVTKESRNAVLYRFTETNIFNEEDVVLKSNKLRQEDNWSFLSNLFHNRRIYYTQKFLKHYFDHFRFDYLFLTGDTNRRHSTQAVGELYLIEMPFLLLGCYFLIKNREKKLLVIVFWLILSLIPASFTVTTPHAIRTLSGLGSWQIITAYGVINFFASVKNRKTKLMLLVTCCLILIINIVYYLHTYYVHYPKESALDWQYGYKEAISYIKDNYSKYDRIIISDVYGRAYGYLLFYLKYEPKKIQEIARDNKEKRKGIGFPVFDKFQIKNIDKTLFNTNEKLLLVGSPGEFPKQAKFLKVIKDLNNQEVFKIMENR